MRAWPGREQGEGHGEVGVWFTAVPEGHCPARVQQPSLQEVLQHLIGMLSQSSALTTLDLSDCQLPELAVTQLCTVLQDQGCCLQTLR